MNRKRTVTACSAALFTSLVLPVSAAPGDAWSFTTCGAAGRLGPAQAACDAAYAGSSLDGAVIVAGGIQAWVVPESATYRIEASGAEGGTHTYLVDSRGGPGASVSGEIVLNAGETVYVLVGQRGEDLRTVSEDNAAPGGGGGTFVYRSATDATPLLAAGGGAGGSRCSAAPGGSAGIDGLAAISGASGGVNGNGGMLNEGGSSYWAGGGAGWLTDGTAGDTTPLYNATATFSLFGANGGLAVRNGGTGGRRFIDGFDEGGDGGFGGGGGGGSDNMGTGGGGGYSGGGGANGTPLTLLGCNNEPGGGGGSLVSGANTTATAAANPGNGQVTFTQLTSGAGGPVTPVPTLSLYGMLMMGLGLLFLGARRLREQV